MMYNIPGLRVGINGNNISEITNTNTRGKKRKSEIKICTFKFFIWFSITPPFLVLVGRFLTARNHFSGCKPLSHLAQIMTGKLYFLTFIFFCDAFDDGILRLLHFAIQLRFWNKRFCSFCVLLTLSFSLPLSPTRDKGNGDREREPDLLPATNCLRQTDACSFFPYQQWTTKVQDHKPAFPFVRFSMFSFHVNHATGYVFECQ